MASRRLDISSLLCDNNPPSFSPLDVLVQAATEERNKINSDDHPPPPPQQQQQQQQQQHQQYDHRVSSPISPTLTRRIPYEDPQFHIQRHHHHHSQQSQQLSHPSQHQDIIPHQDRQQRSQDVHFIDNEQRRRSQQQQYEAEYRERHLVQQRPRDLDLYRRQQAEQELRAQEAQRRQLEEEQRRQREEEQQRILYQREREELVRIERQKEYERRQYEEERRREAERIRELEYQRQLELERRRKEEEVELERRRERERRERERERERELLERERERQQRETEMARLEEERLAEQRRRQRFHDLLGNESYPHSPSIHHLVSSPPPPSTILNISSPLISSDSIPDSRPVKKPRYSQSPIQDNKDIRTTRIDSPVAGPSSAAPHRPGSGHGQTRKIVAVSDLLSDKDQPPSSRPESRDRDPHRILSPLGRRSPPGSQIGRAKAARKSDEHAAKDPVNPPPPPPPPIIPREIKLEIESSKPPPKSEEPIKVKEEVKPRHRVITQDFKPQHVNDDSRPKKTVKTSPPAPPPQPQQPPQPIRQVHSHVEPIRQQDDDPHAWFLSQFEEEPSPTTSARPDPPRSPTPSVSPISSAIPTRPAPPIKAKSPPVSHPSLTPITAAVALEQELEELVSSPTVASKPPPSKVKKQDIADVDMDLEIDAAVSELVGTLEEDDPPNVKHEPVGMEVDVEDELLSLVDERPQQPLPTLAPSNTSRKPLSSSIPASRTSATPTAVPVANVPGSTAKQQQQSPPLRSADSQASPPSSLSVPPPVISSAGPTLTARSSARSTADRESMPPPSMTSSASTSVASAKKGATSVERAGSVVPSASSSAPTKKKPSAKNATEPKTSSSSSATSATKSRAKPAAKGKKTAGAGAPSAAATAAKSTSTTPTTATPISGTAKTGKAQSNKKTLQNRGGTRSRSTSVMPVETDVVKPEKQEEEEEDSDNANDQDKLYCVCKTKYDEDRFMIACDKCDEWYHTQCVRMPELEVDLVDQFICPPCIQKHPHLNLRTTYKQRCLNGLRHPDPSSSKACHKAARGAFSKYCSDDCGVKYMQSLIDNWSKKGNKTDKLLESVKHAEKREGVVHCVVELDAPGKGMMDVDVKQEQDDKDTKPVTSTKRQEIVLPTQTKVEREVERLKGLLDDVLKFKEEIQKGMEVVLWREQLLALASKRSINHDLCGWDQRLCLDDEEWIEMGSSVFEAYDSKKGDDGDVEMDGNEWWCPEDSSCSRHSGWRDVRFKDISKEKDKKENALSKLSARELELRSRILRIQDPDNDGNKEETIQEPIPSVPYKSTNSKLVNGASKIKSGNVSVDTQKKNRKRKVPA
ncbi:hypothetical protein CVT24_011579 [Panaeolus cyanescens]|uniref:PHD-type domain-containing protein n=1 Tax=Panaeolus cyanescens TaxID=181874 RepID=A0A409YV95_9AGAR|nr:hypothetical protein CVT24_011579 [Panaeolus cyanescens]